MSLTLEERKEKKLEILKKTVHIALDVNEVYDLNAPVVQVKDGNWGYDVMFYGITGNLDEYCWRFKKPRPQNMGLESFEFSLIFVYDFGDYEIQYETFFIIYNAHRDIIAESTVNLRKFSCARQQVADEFTEKMHNYVDSILPQEFYNL